MQVQDRKAQKKSPEIKTKKQSTRNPKNFVVTTADRESGSQRRRKNTHTQKNDNIGRFGVREVENKKRHKNTNKENLAT